VSEPSNQIKSLVKVLHVLECFSRHERGLKLAEIAGRTGLPKATAHRLLASLKAIGFIEQGHDREQYRLGLKLFEFGSIVLANMDLPREAQPFVDRLALMSGATVHLCVFDGAQAVFIDRRQTDHVTRNTLTLLEGAPVHCTAVGKAILAFQPTRVVDRVVQAGLTAFTATTITRADDLARDLERIRARGWAVDDEEHQVGTRCVAAPIRNAAGDVIAAMSVSSAPEVIAPDRDAAHGRLVAGIATELSRQLGYLPSSGDPSANG
jgi:DNA-binding IclR family transcriptional regulator